MSSINGVLSSSQIQGLLQSTSKRMDAPAQQLKSQEKTLKSQLSAWGKVQSSLSSLNEAVSGLSGLNSLSRYSASSSNTNVVQASANNSAAAASYNLSGVKLAQSQTSYTANYSSKTTALGTGSISIRMSGGTTTTVSINSSNDTLAGVASAINNASAGVQAAVVNDGSGYRLTLTGNKVGTNHAFTVSATGVSGMNSLSTGRSARNASFTLNGISMSAQSNTVTGAISGLSLTLKSSGATTVNVSRSTTALKNKVQGFVKAYNSAISEINKLTKYTPPSGANSPTSTGAPKKGKAGPLNGQYGLTMLKEQLVSSLSGYGQSVTTSASGQTLAGVGLSLTSSGTITFDSSKFSSAAQKNYAAVAGLVGNYGSTTNANLTYKGASTSTQAGTYQVSVTKNTSGGTVSGTINGQAASGSGGQMSVYGAGAAIGLSVSVSAGVSGSLGQLTYATGLHQRLAGILSQALNSTTGVIASSESAIHKRINNMNSRIKSINKNANDYVSAMDKQFSAYETAISKNNAVDRNLSAIMGLASGSGG